MDGGIVAWVDKEYFLFNGHLSASKVAKDDKKLKEEFVVRESNWNRQQTECG